MTNKLKSLHFAGADFIVSADELTSQFADDLRDCGAGGQDALPAVTYILENYDVSCDPGTARNYLKGYGAWDDAELSDDTANLERLVWLAGCDLCEQGEIYFCTY